MQIFLISSQIAAKRRRRRKTATIAHKRNEIKKMEMSSTLGCFDLDRFGYLCVIDAGIRYSFVDLMFFFCSSLAFFRGHSQTIRNEWKSEKAHRNVIDIAANAANIHSCQPLNAHAINHKRKIIRTKQECFSNYCEKRERNKQ